MTRDIDGPDVRHVARSVALLSAANFVAQALSALSQFILAIWLLPADYGAWAAASSLTAIFTGLANFGEVNGLLADPEADVRSSLRSCFRINLALAMAAVGLAGVMSIRGQDTVAFLIVLCAINIPIQGDANLLYAAHLIARRRAVIVLSQLTAAVVRIGAAAAIAWWTGSALALGIGLIVFSLTTTVIMRVRLVKPGSGPRAPASSLRTRFRWGSQSVAQMLAGQADYLTISATASRHLLGIYFFSYQATVGISSLMAVPLSKTSMAELAKSPQVTRAPLALKLLERTTSIAGLLCSMAVIVLSTGVGLLSAEWQSAMVPVAILISAVPARFVGPLTDSLQMADGRWWRSTSLNTVDAVGTAIAALSAVTGDIVVVACAVSIWKVLLACGRVVFCIWSVSHIRSLVVCGYLVAYSGIVIGMAIAGIPPTIGAGCGAGLTILVWMASGWRGWRREYLPVSSNHAFPRASTSRRDRRTKANPPSGRRTTRISRSSKRAYLNPASGAALPKTTAFVLCAFGNIGAFKGLPILSKSPVDVTGLCGVIALALVMVSRGAHPLKAARPVFYIWIFFIPGAALAVVNGGSLGKSFYLFTLTFIAAFSAALLSSGILAIRMWLAANIVFGVLMAVVLQVRPDAVDMATFGRADILGGTTISTSRVLCAAVVVAAVYLISPGQRHRWLYLPLLLGCGWSALTVGSRGPFISALIAFVVAAIFRRGTFSSRAVGVLGSLSGVILVYIALTSSTSRAAGRILDAFQGGRDDGRSYLRSVAVEHIMQSPWGIGWGGFSRIIGSSTDGQVSYPHNLLLELLLEDGVVPGLLAVLSISVVCVMAWRHSTTTYGAAVFALYLYWLLNSLASSDINGNRMLWVTLGVVCGLAATETLNSVPRRGRYWTEHAKVGPAPVYSQLRK